VGKVVLYMSISLDGFIAGPNDELVRLHDWIFSGQSDRTGATSRWASGDPKDAEVIDEMFRTTGAVIIGRRTYDIGEPFWGPNPPFRVPCYVLTHRAREMQIRGETTFTFVTEGAESALKQARVAARHRNVSLMGAKVAQQFMKAELLDEIQLTVVPVLMREGIRLFENMGTKRVELERERVIESSGATHIKLRVVK
jgi:dihydrofolate reductase